MTTRACKRCQVKPGIAQTRTISARLGNEDVQVVEHTSLCRSCRSDADADNIRAQWRISQGWAGDGTARELFW